MRLKRMRYPELADKKKFNFVFPIGSTEQHGLFIPFGTDTYIIDYLVNQIEEQIPELIILPTLEFSRSQEHRGFFGTVYLTEDTLEKIIFDVCNSIHKKADVIFLTSFHHNDKVIQKFINEKSEFFKQTKIVHLKMCDETDERQIEKLIGGPLDGHAGNTEISNMLIIDESTVVLPTKKDKKVFIDNPFETDNIFEKSSNGIADNHPDWVVNKDVGQKSLDIYTKRIISNIKNNLI